MFWELANMNLGGGLLCLFFVSTHQGGRSLRVGSVSFSLRVKSLLPRTMPDSVRALYGKVASSLLSPHDQPVNTCCNPGGWLPAHKTCFCWEGRCTLSAEILPCPSSSCHHPPKNAPLTPIKIEYEGFKLKLQKAKRSHFAKPSPPLCSQIGHQK